MGINSKSVIKRLERIQQDVATQVNWGVTAFGVISIRDYLIGQIRTFSPI